MDSGRTIFSQLTDFLPQPGFRKCVQLYRGNHKIKTFTCWDQSLCFFVTRAKKNFDFRRLYSRPVDKSTGLQCDQVVMLNGYYARKDYPEKLRRVRYFDSENNKYLVFLTNNFDLPALSIAELYRCRWQVELFFKWTKQHLRIKEFYGTSANAVKTHI